MVMSRIRPPEDLMYAAGGGAGSRLVMIASSSGPTSPPSSRSRRLLKDGSNRRLKPTITLGLPPASPLQHSRARQVRGRRRVCWEKLAPGGLGLPRPPPPPRHDVQVIELEAVRSADRVVAAWHQNDVAILDAEGLVQRPIVRVDALESEARRGRQAVIVDLLELGLPDLLAVVLVRRVARPDAPPRQDPPDH